MVIVTEADVWTAGEGGRNWTGLRCASRAVCAWPNFVVPMQKLILPALPQEQLNLVLQFTYEAG